MNEPIPSSPSPAAEAEAERLLEILASGVAHAFNNVLASARASLQVARDRLGDDALPAELRGLESVLARGSSLTRSLLCIAHARQDRPRPVHLLDLVENTLELLEAGFLLQNLEVTRNFSRAPMILAAQSTVQRALLQSFLQVAASVDARHRDLRLSFTRADGDVAFEIRWVRSPDLAESHCRERLAGAAATLASTGARLVVESGPQRETRLMLRFPPAAAERAESRESARLPSSSGPLSILMIDDEAVLRRMVTSYMTLHGLEMHTAEDGLRGVAMAEATRYDVVLLDLVMPGMPGERVLQQLRDLCPQVPVIILSGLLDENLAEELTRAGAWAVIPKPLQLDRLLRTCREAAAMCAAPGA